MQSLGHSRSAHRADHLLHTPDAFVRASLPGMKKATAIVHAAESEVHSIHGRVRSGRRAPRRPKHNGSFMFWRAQLTVNGDKPSAAAASLTARRDHGGHLGTCRGDREAVCSRERAEAAEVLYRR